MLEDRELTVIPNDLSSGSSLSVAGINPQGEMVGNYLDAKKNIDYGFYRDKEGAVVKIAFVGDDYATPGMMMGINPQGDMTGMAFRVFDDMTTARAFVRGREGRTLELKPSSFALL